MDYPRDDTSYLLGLLGALAAGALAMYLLDPEQGRRRRAQARDQIDDFVGRTRRSLGIAERDPGNRAQRPAAQTRAATTDAKEMPGETAGAGVTLH